MRSAVRGSSVTLQSSVPITALTPSGVKSLSAVTEMRAVPGATLTASPAHVMLSLEVSGSTVTTVASDVAAVGAPSIAHGRPRPSRTTNVNGTSCSVVKSTMTYSPMGLSVGTTAMTTPSLMAIICVISTKYCVINVHCPATAIACVVVMNMRKKLTSSPLHLRTPRTHYDLDQVWNPGLPGREHLRQERNHLWMHRRQLHGNRRLV